MRQLFVYCGAIFALPEAFFFGWYKICTICAENRSYLKSLFLAVENGDFFNHLRNGHLEKSAVTGI